MYADFRAARFPTEASLSCRGEVWHVRGAPHRHVFRYAVWMVYADLDRIADARGAIRTVRAKHLMTTEAVRERLARAGIKADGTHTFALTQPGSFGYSFNPVNFYFCKRGDCLLAVLVDVTNTPWAERHCYVVDARGRAALGRHRFQFAKALHVSPFLSMRGTYRMNLTLGEGRIRIAMRLEGGSAPFYAGLALRTAPLTRAAALAARCRRPFQNSLTLARIYWQAARLHARRTPFFPHPRKLR
ncbi:MAG: DUF1365 domain-containing protein [Gammaproteobacteria bacterium]|nr:DUF1365 domain-containing protein [Gammaproteobacteria bacterium]